MGLLKWLRGGSGGTDLLRLEIAMDYSESMASPGAASIYGLASLRYTSLAPQMVAGEQSYAEAQRLLVAMFYAEVLVLVGTHSRENQEQLFREVGSLVFKSGPPDYSAHFREWVVQTKGGSYPIWPWRVDERFEIVAAHCSTRPYVATLKVGRPTASVPTGFWTFTEMPLGPNVIFMPASALLAIQHLSGQFQNRERMQFHLLLSGINSYYTHLDRFPLGSYPMAIAAAAALVEMNEKSFAADLERARRESDPEDPT